MNKPKLHPHALRSTYANNLVYAGVTESTLCYYMGWNNLQTAVNYVKTSNIAAVELAFDPSHDPAEKLARIQFPTAGDAE